MYKKSDLLYTVLHVPIDILAVIFAFIVSYWLRGNGLEIYRLPFSDYQALFYPAVPIWILIFALQGLYTQRHLFVSLQNLFHLAVSVLAGWASFVVYLAFLKTEQTLVFPRLILIYVLIFSFLFVLIGRVILRCIQFLLRSIGLDRTRLMILGQGKIAQTLEDELKEGREPGVQFILHSARIEPNELVKELRQNKINELIISDHTLSDNQVLEYIVAAQNAGVICHLVPNMFEVQASNVLFTTLAGSPLLTFRQTPLDGWGRIAKRILDIVLSCVGLVVLSPVFLIVALLIKLNDNGPVFYRHTRIQRGGKKFKVYKFRTMLTKFSTGQFRGKSELEIFQELGREDLVEEFKRDHKVKDDPRISRIGKFLRKSNLDELPQLINVLRGELSLVGPRPIVEAELEKYGRWSSYLLSIKPGMTGLWQVSGRNDITYEERVQLDTHYVQNWSLWRDLAIILKTFAVMLGGGNGY